MTESKGPDGQKSGLAEGDLTGIPDQNVLTLNADAVDKYNGDNIGNVFRSKPRQQEQAEHKGTHPDPDPWFADELEFFPVTFNEIHTFYLRALSTLSDYLILS